MLPTPHYISSMESSYEVKESISFGNLLRGKLTPGGEPVYQLYSGHSNNSAKKLGISVSGIECPVFKAYAAAFDKFRLK